MKQGCGILKIQSLTQATGRPFPFRLLNAGWGIAHEPDCLFERADYGYCTIEYVARGRGVLESDGRRFECGPGDVYFLHRHSNHRYWTDPAELWHKLFCMVDGELVDLLMDSYRLAGVYRIAEAPRLRQHFEALAALGGDGAVRDMRAAAIFHQLLEACAETLYERTLPARPEVVELKRELDGCTDGGFRLEEFAGRSGYSAAHLIRHVREAFGCPPYEYLMRRRVETAQRLLTYTRKSVKEIAAALGFSDQYYFSGCFKARTGVSPTAYRSGK